MDRAKILEELRLLQNSELLKYITYLTEEAMKFDELKLSNKDPQKDLELLNRLRGRHEFAKQINDLFLKGFLS